MYYKNAVRRFVPASSVHVFSGTSLSHSFMNIIETIHIYYKNAVRRFVPASSVRVFSGTSLSNFRGIHTFDHHPQYSVIAEQSLHWHCWLSLSPFITVVLSVVKGFIVLVSCGHWWFCNRGNASFDEFVDWIFSLLLLGTNAARETLCWKCTDGVRCSIFLYGFDVCLAIWLTNSYLQEEEQVWVLSCASASGNIVYFHSPWLLDLHWLSLSTIGRPLRTLEVRINVP